MADFAKRPEVTVSTMGKVHNPSGEGVRAMSSQVQAKTLKHKEKEEEALETKTKEGTAKRNIQRKKNKDSFDSSKKKQGGHGKGQWKEMMDPSYTNPIPLDEDDPIYDHAEDSRYILASSEHNSTDIRGVDPETNAPVYGPLLTKQEFKVQFGEILREFFDSCDPEEVVRSLDELGCVEYSDEIVKRAVSLAMDKGPRERELVSRLLTYLHPYPLQSMEAGFDILLDSLDDLETDVPDAKVMAASFLARAVVDEVLPPAYLSEQNNQRPGNLVIEKAVTLLSREHCTARLERIWGPGDGRPVDELKNDMDQLLQEYLMSRELDEAARCVKELEAVHFHHELVKRGVTLAMEADGKSQGVENLDAMAALFGFLTSNAIVSEHQVNKGLHRVKERLPDLSLDVPAAPQLLETFENFAKEQGCLPEPST